MLSSILSDALSFVPTLDLAAMLHSSRHFSAVAEGVVARRTIRAVWIRLAGPIHVSAAFAKPSGGASFQFATLSASDNVMQKLRSLLCGGIVEVFGLHANALAAHGQDLGWFADALRPLLAGVVVSRTLRLHMSKHAASVESIYAMVERFHYVEV